MKPETESMIAERIARNVHSGQVDLAGEPYIQHVERVAAMVDEPAKAVAWLHDVLEDTILSEWELRTEGIERKTIESLRLLNRNEGPSTYAEYIDAIVASGDPIARAVKIADVRDHLRPNCPERLRPRYERALTALLPPDPVEKVSA